MCHLFDDLIPFWLCYTTPLTVLTMVIMGLKYVAVAVCCWPFVLADVFQGLLPCCFLNSGQKENAEV